MNRKALSFVLSFFCLFCFGQQNKKDSLILKPAVKNFKYSSLIIPSTLMAFGFIGLENDNLKLVNEEIREEVKEHIDGKFTIDDISQYTPMASVYVLDALGVKAKHSVKDQTIILGTAYLIMGSTVYGLKKITQVQRPDGSSFTSFPSGHTATAFMGAEFLFQEFKDISIWYGVTGYVIATGTGFFRMYNNRHWLTDVAAGAGIGMLSTKIAYWLHPFIKRTIFKGKKSADGMAMPFYDGRSYGLSMSISL